MGKKGAKSLRPEGEELSKSKAQVLAFEKSYEALLGPILLLLDKAGPCSQQELAARLDHMLPDRERSYVRGRTGVTISSALGTALANLRGAGLIELGSRVSITDAGRRFREATGGTPALKELRALPAFDSWQKGLERDHKRREFLNLRFQSYVAGRVAAQAGLFLPSGMLLAYAIEYHLKAPFADRGEPKLSHDLVELMKDCRAEGWYREVRIAEDFLRYATDHFKMRYPKLAEEVFEERGGVSYSSALLHTYDDALIQLDLALADHYEDMKLSMGAHALAGSIRVGRAAAEHFFVGNIHALSALDRYRVAGGEERFSAAELDRPEGLYSGARGSGVTLPFEIAQKLKDCELAGWFVYTRPGQPDPDPVRLLGQRLPRAGVATRASKLVEEISREFGPGRVEVIEDRPNGETTVRVFDRGATQWWVDVQVERDHRSQARSGTWSQDEIGRVIREVHESFQKRRALPAMVSEKEREALLRDLERMKKTKPYLALKEGRATENDLVTLRTVQEHFRRRATGGLGLPEVEEVARMEADRAREAHEERAFQEGLIPPWLSWF